MKKFLSISVTLLVLMVLIGFLVYAQEQQKNVTEPVGTEQRSVTIGNSGNEKCNDNCEHEKGSKSCEEKHTQKDCKEQGQCHSSAEEE